MYQVDYKKFRDYIKPFSGIVTDLIYDEYIKSLGKKLRGHKHRDFLHLTLINLYLEHELVGVSKFRTLSFNQYTVSPIIEWLHNNAYVTLVMHSVSEKQKIPTRIKRTQKLEKIFAENKDEIDKVLVRTVIWRGARAQEKDKSKKGIKTKVQVQIDADKKTEIQYRDSIMSKHVELLNNTIIDTAFRPLCSLELSIVYSSSDLNFSGRIYNSCTNLSKSERETITFDNEATVEIDFQSSAPNPSVSSKGC